MVEINASFRYVEANISSYQAVSQRQSLAINTESGRPRTALENPQQQQLIDEINISDAALQNLQDAQALAAQLQNYTDYLYGRNSGENQIRITIPNDNASVTIAGQSSTLAASVTAGSITEKTLDISAKFDDAGNLETLSVTRTQTNIDFVNVELLQQDTQFYAQI